ncbi:nuclear transport factor 2 family protein [Shewanella gaetbuli]|uniref:Nuclear transport factor 2 family protein n=1 Tax=Shewanella gaetbuli TaxID=220752 RepID=A0A9X2CGY1_9GAMM|nr:nuclear transport factor 2 family protein [Shewanella gaetbuli]MCL1142893.1 nuclear transport factor 2 family protein [Shewanella gaetbuli]
MMRLLVSSLLCILTGCFAVGAAHADEKLSIVNAFVEAFNQRDPDKMGTFVTNDVVWFDVAKTEMSHQTDSKKQLIRSMQDYFTDANRAHSRVINAISSGQFISTVEQVSWQKGDQWMSQCSIGVYQFKKQKIAAVWYYKSHDCD